MQPERRFVWRRDSDAKAAAALAPARSRVGLASHACRILVVDDDVLVRAQLCALLHTSGYEVETASSGDDALSVLRTSPCDIVVTDWHMPRMDGVALCRQLRATNDHAYVFLLMFTIKQTPQELLAGFAAGVDDYVVKGTSNAELLARLETGRRTARWRIHSGGTDGGEGEKSLIDVSTGTYNLLYMMEHLPRELARSERYGHSLALLSCDLNGSAPSDEVPGHVAGEKIARDFISTSTPCLRKADWVTRTARKEFMIVLPETNQKGAQCVARKLSEAFAGRDTGAATRPEDGSVKIDITSFAPQDSGAGVAQIQALIRKAEILQSIKKRPARHLSDTETMHYLNDSDLEEAKGGRNWPAT